MTEPTRPVYGRLRLWFPLPVFRGRATEGVREGGELVNGAQTPSPTLPRRTGRGGQRSPTRLGVGVLAVYCCAVSLNAATIRKADDTVVVGRVIAIRGDKLIVVPAASSGAVPNTTTAASVAALPTPNGTSGRTTSQRLFPANRPSTTPVATQPAASQPVAKSAVTQPTTMAIAAASQPAEIEIPLEDVAEVAPLFEPGAPTAVAPATRPVVANPTSPVDSRPWKLKLIDGQAVTLQNGQWSDGNLCGMIIGGKLALAVPSTFVAEWWCGANDQVKAAAALGEQPGLDDIAYAARDKSVLAVRGVAVGVQSDGLKFKYGGQDRSIAIGRLVGVVFARTLDTANRTKPMQVITVAGNEQFNGTWTGLDEKAVSFTTAWGQSLQLSRTDVNKIVFRNGRVVSLSDLTPIDVKQTPYFDRMLPWQADKGLDGKPLQLDGPVPRGLAMHSQTALTYALDGGFAEFKSRIGFEQPAGRLGDVVLRVRGDGRTLLEKPSFKGTEKPTDLTINVSGVQKLTIEVDFGVGQDVGDRVIWAAPRLIRPAK